MSQILRHTEKADFAVVDLTEFAQAHVSEVQGYINSLPETARQKIIRIGF